MHPKSRCFVVGTLLGVVVTSLVWIAGLGLVSQKSVTSGPVKIGGTVEAHFSPRGGCTEAVVAQIDRAKHAIYVQAYSFTSEEIGQALILAHRRGVKVEALVDKGQFDSKHTIADDLDSAGAVVLFDGKHAIAHNKIMLIDGEVVITGSFNFTAAAEKSNAENLLVISGDRGLHDTYLANYNVHREHSAPFRSMKKRG